MHVMQSMASSTFMFVCHCGKHLCCRAISQLNKQLVEQQNAIPAGDKHENGTETTASDPQLDGVLAHKEKIAKLEDELETAKHEHRKTMDKLKVHLCLYLHMHFNVYVYPVGVANCKVCIYVYT